MDNETAEALRGAEEQKFTVPTKPILKRVSCIYVPVTDPDKSRRWFETFFGLHHGEMPWLTLANDAEVIFVKADKGALMSFQTDEWAGPGFQMRMLAFSVVKSNSFIVP